MATRPSQYPRWATSGVKTQPTTGQQTQGWGVGQKPPAQVDNWWKDLADQWIEYQDAVLGVGLFGNGSDGAIVLDGVTPVSGMGLGGATYTLQRDFNCTDLTINSGVTLAFGDGTGSYRLYGTGTLTVLGTGSLGAPGNLGVDGNLGGNGGAGYGNAGSVLGSFSGGAGNIASGSAGTAATNTRGGAGGAGGHGPATSSGAGGTATAAAAGRGSSQQSFGAMMGHAIGISGGASTPIAFTGGAGGGGGGGDNSTNKGSGGGGGGGVAMISFRSIVLPAATAITVAGGAGGNSHVPNTGGGGGGGGGYLRVICMSLNITGGGTLSAAVNCAGGLGGSSGGGSGTAGANGSVGALELTIGDQSNGVGLSSTHIEKGVINMATGGSGAGFDFGVASFSANFAVLPGTGGGYMPQVTLTPTDGAASAPGYKVTFALNQMTITPVEQFNGIISWRAEI